MELLFGYTIRLVSHCLPFDLLPAINCPDWWLLLVQI